MNRELNDDFLPADSSEVCVVDGSMGEGGGQVVRSTMAIAAVTGQTVEIRNVRARRSPPGLKAQHLTAARAAAAICDGELVGGEVGSKNLRLVPQKLRGGDYFFDIGTAGSTMLVMQTVLPALLLADEPSTVELIGGTHNPMAPSWEFVDRVYLPMLQRMGADIQWTLHQRGFYPRGGGRVSVNVQPRPLRPMNLLLRGPMKTRLATAICANLPDHIGEREVDTVARTLQWSAKETRVVVDTETHSPGNTVIVDMQFEHSAELITEHGKVGLPAEKVAKRAAREAKKFLLADVPVGEHLADQLMTPMALIACSGAAEPSSFRTLPLSLHSNTLVVLLQQLLPVSVDVQEDEDEAVITIDARESNALG